MAHRVYKFATSLARVCNLRAVAPQIAACWSCGSAAFEKGLPVSPCAMFHPTRALHTLAVWRARPAGHHRMADIPKEPHKFMCQVPHKR